MDLHAKCQRRDAERIIDGTGDSAVDTDGAMGGDWTGKAGGRACSVLGWKIKVFVLPARSAV